MSSPAAPLELLERGIRGPGPEPDATRDLVRGWISGSTTDAQMSAWLMLARERGLDTESARALTAELVASGKRLDLARLGPTGTLGTTGAVGGTVILVAAPLAAALGVRVVVNAEPTVGIVGGVRDLLEAIPGYRVGLTVSDLASGLRDAGCVMVHPHSLAPAEGRLAVLRDQTATADATDVTVAAAMARMLAAGGGALSLELPHGDAAHLPDAHAARRAAELARAIGEPWGRPVFVAMVPADRPVGRTVGHAVGVREAGQVLRGEGPAEVRGLAVALAAGLAEAAGLVPDGEGEERARGALADGSALAAAESWVAHHGGDPEVWTEDLAVSVAPASYEVTAPRDGHVLDIPGRVLGEVARRLGCGRLHPSQTIDHSVGIEIVSTVGEPVAAGDAVLLVRARDAWLGEAAVEALTAAVVFGHAPPPPGGDAPGG